MECTYDRLEIFDGADTAARQLARLCGSGLPNPVVSTGNRLYMTFYTDASVQRKGFEITHTTGTRRYDVVRYISGRRFRIAPLKLRPYGAIQICSLLLLSLYRNLGILRYSRRHVIGDLRRPASA